MSMETNEIEKNTITAENTENAQIKENSQPSVQQAEQVNENTKEGTNTHSQQKNSFNMFCEMKRFLFWVPLK